MITISTITKNKESFQGAITQKSFENQGFANVTFYISRNQVGVEVEGFCAANHYSIRKGRNATRSNALFIERYINNCEEKDLLLFVIESIEKGVFFIDEEDLRIKKSQSTKKS